MQEYRTSLIAHVVTGKLDVRAAAAQLPPRGAPELGTGQSTKPSTDYRTGLLLPETWAVASTLTPDSARYYNSHAVSREACGMTASRY